MYMYTHISVYTGQGKAPCNLLHYIYPSNISCHIATVWFLKMSHVADNN